jgi:hypothetical protein
LPDPGEIVCRQIDVNGADILLEPRKLGHGGDRNDPGLLCHQPCACDLGRLEAE